MALKLKRRGISEVYPLVGGLEAWMADGLPTEQSEPFEPSLPSSTVETR